MHAISTQVLWPCLFTLTRNKSHRALTRTTDSVNVFRTHNGPSCLHFPNFTWCHYVTRRNSDCHSLRHAITLENISLVSQIGINPRPLTSGQSEVSSFFPWPVMVGAFFGCTIRYSIVNLKSVIRLAIILSL